MIGFYEKTLFLSVLRDTGPAFVYIGFEEKPLFLSVFTKKRFIYRFVENLCQFCTKTTFFIGFKEKSLFISVLRTNHFFYRFLWKNAFFIGFFEKPLFFRFPFFGWTKKNFFFYPFPIVQHFLSLLKTTFIYHFRSGFLTNRLPGMSLFLLVNSLAGFIDF